MMRPKFTLRIDIAQAPVRPPNIAVVVEEVAELTASVKGKSGEVIMGYTFGPARTKAEDTVWESFRSIKSWGWVRWARN